MKKKNLLRVNHGGQTDRYLEGTAAGGTGKTQQHFTLSLGELSWRN